MHQKIATVKWMETFIWKIYAYAMLLSIFLLVIVWVSCPCSCLSHLHWWRGRGERRRGGGGRYNHRTVGFSSKSDPLECGSRVREEVGTGEGKEVIA